MLYRVPFLWSEYKIQGKKLHFLFLEVKNEFAPQPFENYFGLFLIERKQYEARTVELFLHLVLFSIHIYKYDVLKIFMKNIPVTSLIILLCFLKGHILKYLG